MSTKTTTGNAVKREREKQGISQTDLAHMAGIPQNTLSDMENNKHTPTFDNLEAVVTALSRNR